MSGRISSALTFVSIVAIALAADHAAEFNESAGLVKTSPSRTPSTFLPISPLSAKEKILGEFIQAPEHKHTEKVRGPVSVELGVTGDLPTQIGDIFVLRGEISSSEYLGTVHFKWAIPKGVELLSGAKDGTVTNVYPNTPTLIEVTLKKLSSQNEQIHLHAEHISGESRSGAAAQFNTDFREIVVQESRPQLKIGISAKGLLKEDRRQIKVFH